ncbi:MAG TPA: hypothetical protein VNE63_08370 [Candidatus Acidoferrales bacterium]|nr:hypothetical protein [Candidatus Acidoferrales bacterium]
MAGNNAAELLIRIAADPSQAESSIQEFRSKFGSNLSGMTSDISQWSSQGTKNFGGVQQSLGGLTTSFGSSLGSLNTSFNQSRQTATLWRSDISSAFTTAMSASGALQTSLLGSFQLFDSALVRNIGNASVWQKSVGQAFEKAALTSISAIAKEAIVRALFSTALGFYMLAVGDFAGAGQAFEAAAVFGAVGGAAGLASSALGGGSSSSSKSSSGSTSKTSKSSTSAQSTSSKTSSSQQQTVQIIFQGPIYGGQAGIDQLTQEISRAVQERDVNLVAYTTVRQPATRA